MFYELRDLLYGILMKSTIFVRVWEFIEECFNFNIKRTLFGRFIIKATNLIVWIMLELLLICMTQGLYLIWIGFKILLKIKKSKRNKKHDKKQSKKRA